jgi:hypothetical protein
MRTSALTTEQSKHSQTWYFFSEWYTSIERFRGRRDEYDARGYREAISWRSEYVGDFPILPMLDMIIRSKETSESHVYTILIYSSFHFQHTNRKEIIYASLYFGSSMVRVLVRMTSIRSWVRFLVEAYILFSVCISKVKRRINKYSIDNLFIQWSTKLLALRVTSGPSYKNDQ